MSKPDCPHCLDKVCRHDGRTWKRLCDAAQAEENALHERAAAEHRERMQQPEQVQS